ncbi:MAG: hypothetical protein K9K32_07705 [Halanaerobiales bacterium]|nr:hypothetical protein [Halanaerobiales bacterium]
MSYPWAEIKAKYETGKYSMAELSDEYGFHAKYGANKAKRDGWEKGRLEDKIEEKATEKMIEEKAEKEKQLREEYEKIITNIRRGAYNTLFKEKDFNRLKQFKIASQIMRNCRKEQWEINGIKEVATKLEQEITGKDGGAIEIERSAKEKVKSTIDSIASREEKE